MIAKKVTSIEQVQIVRLIRNIVRHHMTNYSGEVTSAEQVKFFSRVQEDQSIFLHLYYDENLAPVGYSFVQKKNDRYWGTLAVHPEFQSMGYGTEIYKHMKSLVPVLWVEIFSDNNASLISALRAGFIIQGAHDQVILLSKGIENDDTTV